MASTNYELELSDDGKTLEGIAGIRTPADGPVDVIIPDGVTDIGDRAFYKHTFTIEKVVLPDSIKKLGAGAFYSETLKSILIPDSVTDIGDNVCDRANTVMEVVPGSYAALYASENGYPVSNTTGDDTSWLD